MNPSRTPFLVPLLCGLTFVAGLAAPAPAKAAQGQGALAQAPLVNDIQIPPSFIMAVDDSGSMTFETLFPGQDGMACSSRDGNHRYYNDNGTLRTSSGNDGTCNYHHIMPYPGHRIGTTRYAIPPLDSNGFARSPEINPQYYDPNVTYQPWIDQNLNSYPNATPSATRADPRSATPTFNMTAPHRDRTDDNESATQVDSGTVDLSAGDWLEAGWRIRNAENSDQTCSLGGSNRTVPRSSNTQLTVPAGGWQVTGSCTSVRVWRPQNMIPESDEMFRVTRNTLIPAGTWYYTTSSCGGFGGTTFRRNYWVRVTSDFTTSATCTVGLEYFPATFYLRTTTPAPAGFITANRVLAQNACGSGCNMYRYEIKPGNYSSTAAYNAQIQNFANWFSYYGNRNRAMVAGMTRSLAPVNNMYVGFFTINNRVAVTMRNMANAADKSALYTAMLALPASGSTPNRHAVDHMGAQFKRTNTGAPIRLACQKNAGMLFTDGYSNQDGPSASPTQNADGGMGPPFADSHNNTLADLAAQYYLNNLRPDLPAGQVPVPEACNSPPVAGNVDCQRNLHMNFYGITLGAKGNIYGVNSAATANPFANPPAWEARQNDNPSTVDEIWHATLNARGKFINAQSPEAITTAMREILDAIGEQEGPSGTIALSGARVGDTSLTVQPSYGVASQGTDWYGDLAAQTVSVDATGQVAYSTLWTASAALPAHGARNILFTLPSASVTPTAAQFTGANLSDVNRLCNAPLAFCVGSEITSSTGLNVTRDQAVAYLRGDRSLEGTRLRVRTSPLGDIVNSTPVISAPTDDYGYRALRGNTVTQFDPWGYQAYLTSKATRPRMVYVGANDGMLHAFHGTTGVEQFAFIPSTSVSYMGNLLFPYDAADANDQRFQHRYYVDGPVTVSDARIGTDWRTMLVGTGGAGAKGLFALNVSSPTAFTSGNFMWEVAPGNTGHGAYIGNILGKPVVVPTRSGTSNPVWKVIVGNGYGSSNGTAQLLVIDAGTGTVTRIPAIETGGPTTPNGLGSVVVVDQYIGSSTDLGRDGYADTAYAGDLHGNLWKFDLRNNTVANGGLPVFRATAPTTNARQPITGGLEVATGPGGGKMIFFGTGSYAFEEDPADSTMQTVYAVLDPAPSTPTTYTRANLASQSIAAGTTVSGQPTRTITPGQPNYLTQNGWYMDLAVGGSLRGERFVANPRLQSGNILFVTFEPAGGTADPCDTTGSNWLYALNITSGAPGLSGMRLNSPTGTGAPPGTGGIELATNSDMPIRDVAVLVVPPPAAVEPTATAAERAAALDRTCDLVINVAGAPPMYLPRACGRQSWRQIR